MYLDFCPIKIVASQELNNCNMSNHGSQILDNIELVFLRQTKPTSTCLATSISRTLCFWGEEYSAISTSSEKLTVVCCGISWGEKGVELHQSTTLRHYLICWCQSGCFSHDVPTSESCATWIVIGQGIRIVVVKVE